MEDLRSYEEGHYCHELLHEDESDSYSWLDLSIYSEMSFSQDELPGLSEVDFTNFWAQVEEEDARRESKESDCESAVIKVETCGSVEKGKKMQAHPAGRGSARKSFTFEQVSRYFSMPIKQAARELGVGLTVLKKRCRDELGIPRWPHRKVKSMQTLIDNVQELGKENAQGEIRTVVERLQQTKKLIEEKPEVMLDKMTKQLRQACFKEKFKRRRLIMDHGAR